MKTASKKIVSFVLAATMLMSGLAIAPVMAQAAEIGTKNTLTPQLVERTDAPQPTDSSSPQFSPMLDESIIVEYGGYQWVVIGWDGEGVASEEGTATLLYADTNINKPTSRFISNALSNIYAGSALFEAMDSFHENIPEKERGYILPRHLTGGSDNFSFHTDDSVDGHIETASFNSAANDGSLEDDEYIYGFRLEADATFDWYAYDRLRKSGDLSAGESPRYTGHYHPDNVAGDSLQSEHLWPLSIAEVSLLDKSIRTYNGNNYWWLRSPGHGNERVAIVFHDGRVGGGGNNANSANAIRPSLHLDLQSVLFLSGTSGTSAKSAIAVEDGFVAAEAPNGVVKLTMLDDSLALTVSNTIAMIREPGTQATIEYSEVETGVGKYLSAIITDEDDAVLYYSKLVDLEMNSEANGTASFYIPSDIAEGNYIIKLFNEEINGDNQTDFASLPIAIELEVLSTPRIDVPTVSSIIPVDGATNISTSGEIVITFSEAMDISLGTVILTPNGGNPQLLTGGSWNSPTDTVYTTSYSSLDYGTEYTITISGFQDLAGNAMTANNSNSFTTMTEPDITPPSVIGITPASNADNVNINGSIEIVFNEAIDTSSGTVTLTPNGGNPQLLTGGSWNSPTDTIYTASYSSLDYGTEYTITISGFQNLAGNAMTANNSNSFTTMMEPDITPPSVIGITPASNADNVNINGSIEIVFSEAIDTSSGTVTLTPNGGNPQLLTVGSWNSPTDTIYTTSYSSLDYGTEYTITIENFESMAGTQIAPNPTTYSFTTKEQPSGPDVSPSSLNLDLNGNSSGALAISLGQSGNSASQADIVLDSGNRDDISVNLETLTDDGSVIVTGLRVVSSAGITVTFSGGDLASPTDILVTVNVTDSTPTPGTSYTITFDANTGSVSPATMQTDYSGKLSYLPTPTRSGSYRFDGWFTALNGGTQITTETVFPANQTIYAHWTYTGTDSSSKDDSDNSSSSSSSSNSNSTATGTVSAVRPDQPTIGFYSAKAAGTNTQKTFTITDSMVKAALEKARAEAQALNRLSYGIGARIALDAPASTGLTIIMEHAALNRLVSENAKCFEITGIPVGIAVDAQALLELQKQSPGNVTIAINSASVANIHNAYNITISTVKDGKSVRITSLGAGAATLSIPTVLGKNEALGGFYAITVDGSGKATRIPGSAYDSNGGNVIFNTNSFSVYGVGYTAPSAKFTDIDGHWAKDFIDYVVGRGLFGGTTETTFLPDKAITRGDFVTTLGRLAGVNSKAYTKSSFTDVKVDAYYSPYIEWAYSKGIIQGIGNGQFAPDRAITRQEIAVILQSYAKATGYKLPVTRESVAFADAYSIGSAYETAVTAMQQAGIMMGDKTTDSILSQMPPVQRPAQCCIGILS